MSWDESPSQTLGDQFKVYGENVFRVCPSPLSWLNSSLAGCRIGTRHSSVIFNPSATDRCVWCIALISPIRVRIRVPVPYEGQVRLHARAAVRFNRQNFNVFSHSAIYTQRLFTAELPGFSIWLRDTLTCQQPEPGIETATLQLIVGPVELLSAAPSQSRCGPYEAQLWPYCLHYLHRVSVSDVVQKLFRGSRQIKAALAFLLHLLRNVSFF